MKRLRRTSHLVSLDMRNPRRFIARRERATSQPSQLARFWIFPITRGPRSTGDGPCLRFSSGETTRKWLSGGALLRLKKPAAIVPIYCQGNKMERLEVLIHPMMVTQGLGPGARFHE